MNGNRLYYKIIKAIRENYVKLLEDEHKAFNINKITRVLSRIEKPEEQSLLKALALECTKNLEEMSFNELIHTINMIFPYILREQILIYNKQKISMQNKNPAFNKQFMDFY